MAPCIVGQLRITGDEIEFVPGESVASVPAGVPLELGVRFDYAEASHRKERCDVAFDLHHPDEGLQTVTLQVEDRPARRDAGLGMLAHHALFARPGEVRVRYALRIAASSGSWLGGTSAATSSAHEGEVLVRVV